MELRLVRSRSEEVMERIRNQSGHREGHEDVLRNQERRKMFHGASRRVDLCKVYLPNRWVQEEEEESMPDSPEL
jgi:hypothetical protein